MTIVERPKPADRNKTGFSTERMLDWPTDAVSASRRYPGEPWEFVFKSDVLKAKRESMDRNLQIKRTEARRCRALYVWVFWCPGVAGFAFRGWWTYLIGVGGKQYTVGGVKGNADGEILRHIMQIFPVANPLPLLGPVSHYDWMPLFARKYQRGLWCGKPQGKAPVWATTKRGRVLAINEPGCMKKGGLFE